MTDNKMFSCANSKCLIIHVDIDVICFLKSLSGSWLRVLFCVGGNGVDLKMDALLIKEDKD